MTTQSRFAFVLTLSFLFFFLVQDTLAFSSVPVRVVLSRTSTTRSTTPSSYMSILDDLNNDNTNIDDASKLPETFNPLNYKSTKKRNSAYSYSGTTISLRTTNMQLMINALIRVAGNAIESETILQENKDFLLEPLDDLQAVLDPDSVYTSEMSRAERYQAYRKFMDERLLAATKPQARAVLASMRDFVLRYEPKE